MNVTIMSVEFDPEPSEKPDESEDDERTPYSTQLAELGRKMRVYGNAMLVLMIVTFLTSIFIFQIVYRPTQAALIIIFCIKVFEFGFFIDFLVALKRSDSTYAGHHLYKAFFLYACMILINTVVLIIGTIVVMKNTESLTSTYSAGLTGENAFFYYTLMSEAAPWLRFIELLIPGLFITGSMFMYKWGILFIGDRLEEELQAPYPKEMRLMISGAGITLLGIALGIVISYLGSILPAIDFLINLLQIIGTIIMSVGFSRAGYYLELYTTKDKKKFFSSRVNEDDD